ncbi:hypothetical protein ILUMI_08132 [Ignelater luminosus]|uniref:HTH CENPB-type domain-containing protein n=1 Tax=Ignelater luminosus TaxID=2038154 RepID=A0A8K0D272_IGNLU|nr:hypothetical protein ILUMI_08132 [Ignelater luminosus]
MVHKYKKKTSQGTWSKDVMETAINLCRAGESVKGTAKKYGLAYATLYRHVKIGVASPQLGRFRPVLTEDQETELVNYLKDMDAVFFSLTRVEFMSLAFDYAHYNKLQYPESWSKNKKAGEDWLQRFLSRHTNLTLRTPESTSVARAKGFNRCEVCHFYENLESAIEKNNIEASRLYNMDETGISTTSNKPPKVLSVKGKRQVGMTASAERGQLTTVIGKEMQPRLLDGSPPGTQGTQKGPFVVGQTHFEREVNIFQKTHPGRIINQYDIARLLAPAFFKTAVAINAVHGFERPGIWPVNKQSFGDEHFAPAEVLAGTANLNTQADTLHPLERIDLPESVIEASPSTESNDEPLSLTNATLQFDSIINPTQEEHSPILESINPLTVSSPDEVESRGFLSRSQSQDDVAIEDRPSTSTGFKTTKETQSNDVPAVSPEPGTSKTYYSPSVLRPIPQPAKPITTRKRKLQRSSILTSTPVKEEQKQKLEKARKTAMKSLDDLPNKASQNTAKANKKTVKPKISAKKPKKTAKENKKQKKIVKFHNVDCIFCGEIYIKEDGQPTENWIQCNLCTQWCHEEC